MRCGECSCEVSPWAARCPECGTPVDQAIDGESTVNAIRAKRPLRVTLVVGVLAGALVVAAGAVWWTDSDSHRTAPSASRPVPVPQLPGAGETLVYGAGPLTLATVGSSGTASFPGTVTAGYPVKPVAVDDGVVFISDGEAETISPTLGFISLGPATSEFASTRPGWVWLARLDPAGALLREVRFDGTDSGPEVALPPGSLPVAAVDEGVVLRDPDQMLEIWNPADRTTSLRLGPVASLIDARGGLVAFTRSFCADGTDCDLHVMNVGSGRETRIKAPPGTGGFVGGGAISPDGTMLAAFVGGTDDDRGPTVDLVVVDLRTARTSPPIPGSHIVVGESVGSAAWSPSGRWLFFCGLEGPMNIYAPGDPSAAALDQLGSYAFTVTEAHLFATRIGGSAPASRP